MTRILYKNAEEATIGLLSDPGSWPNYPFLPVKRLVNENMQTGVIWASEKTKSKIIVRRCNLFDIPELVTDFILLESETFHNVNKLLEAGWIVD